MFDKHPIQSVVLWTILIVGYVEHEHHEEALICFEHMQIPGYAENWHVVEALMCFKQMQLEGISQDILTFACTLKASSIIKSTRKGRGIHAMIETTSLLKQILYTRAGNALVSRIHETWWWSW